MLNNDNSVLPSVGRRSRSRRLQAVMVDAVREPIREDMSTEDIAEEIVANLLKSMTFAG